MKKNRSDVITAWSQATGAFVCAAVLTSCSNSSHLLLYQQSNIGLNLGLNPATQNMHVRIGLRRQFGAIVPKYTTGMDNLDGTLNNKAASAYFGSRARITNPFRVPEVAEVMATGSAAVIAAKSGKALNFTDQDAAPKPATVTTPVVIPPQPPIPPKDETYKIIE